LHAKVIRRGSRWANGCNETGFRIVLSSGSRDEYNEYEVDGLRPDNCRTPLKHEGSSRVGQSCAPAMGLVLI
jgi:hypothetical protein